jgi:HAD superfamily hydrolase (TIGR01549 family)
LRAVIFDFDGVIADTMEDNCNAWKKSFSDFGFDMNESEYYLLEGMGRYQIAQYFIGKYFLDPDIKSEVVTRKEFNYKVNSKFRLFDYIVEILLFLQSKHLPMAIVTGASRERLHESLADTVSNFFDVIVTSDDVINPKPNPESYIKAVNLLNVPADACIVVENAILGIQSAKAAGCKCFALQTTMDAKVLKDADEIFASHFDLFERFKYQFA